MDIVLSYHSIELLILAAKEFSNNNLHAFLSYLHVADPPLLEGAVLQVVGADVTIFAPVAGKQTADAGRTPDQEGDI